MLKLIIPVLGLALAMPAQARDEGGKDNKEANKSLIEHHQKMADIHKKAASCLKKNSETECRQQVVKDCPMAKEHCTSAFDHGSMGKDLRDAPRDVPSGTDSGSSPSGSDIESGSPGMESPSGESPSGGDSGSQDRGY